MAALDGGNIAFTGHCDETIAFEVDDNGLGLPASIIMTIKSGSMSWTEPHKTSAEVRNNGKHLTGGPVVRDTTDGDVTMTLTVKVSSYKSLTAANASPYEFVRLRDVCSAYVPTAAGDAKTIRVRATYDSTKAGGGTQDAVFAYCKCTNIEIDPIGEDGLTTMAMSFVDYENEPTIS